LVKLASSQGLRAIAITDHDTILGIPEALKEGRRSGMEVIPGTELSIEYVLPNNGHIHILGLFIDLEAEALNKGLAWLRKKREERTPKILGILREQGMDIPVNEVNEIAGKGAVGRPHIARLMLKKGYASSINDAFERYLKKGAVAYVPKEKLGLEQAVNLIREAKGIPIFAHPFTLNLSFPELDELLIGLKDIGLRGIEAFYSTHSKEQTKGYLELAEKHDLLVSGGTDFHGENKPGINIGTGFGDLRIPYSLVERMKMVI
ncbi:MAG: PHP domain-containing protein, partial [Thermoplasmata archaeon]|nr:PHP domain-containing protein [Thermoplasmata archaeon]